MIKRLYIIFAMIIFGWPLIVHGSPKKMEIRFGTVQAAGSHYVYCVNLAKVLSQYVPEINVNVIETGASIENLHLANRGDIDMGIASFDSINRAYKGVNEFRGEANPELRLLWPSAFLPVNIIVSKESGVKSLYDLEGKKFNGGGTGTATEQVSLSLFDALGIKPKFFRGGLALARDAMKNRQIAGFIKTVVPDQSVMDVAQGIDIRFLELPEADFEKATANYPGTFIHGGVAANSYGKGLPPKFVPTFALVVIDFTTSRLPQDIGYKMAKAVYEHPGEIEKAFKYFKEGFSNFPTPYVNDAPIYLHAGVVKFIKELGVDVPRDKIPPEFED